MSSYWQWIHGSMLGRSFDEASFFEVRYFLFRMKKVSFFGLVASFLVMSGILLFSVNLTYAACREVTCMSSCGTQLEVTNACKTELGCTEKACVPNSFVASCPNFNTQCAVSCIGEDDPTCALVACPTGTKYCKAAGGATTACTYNGQSGKCIGEGEVCNGTAGRGDCSNDNTTCCISNAATACTGGGCKATCATGESEDTTCTLSQCTGSMKYCKSSTTTPGGGTATAVKCDPAKFKEYAGVCFPLNTGLSETSVASIIINLMKWMLYLFGFLAIIAFVISGIQYLSAAGNMNMIETAKRNMNYSIIGVIVALSGLVILIAVDSLLRATGWGG